MANVYSMTPGEAVQGTSINVDRRIFNFGERVAELAPNQKDSDSLPDYSILDQIIELYVEKDLSSEEIVKKGINKKQVRKIINLIDRNEYKRRQAPLGVKITDRGFGKDRRYPITNKYLH